MIKFSENVQNYIKGLLKDQNKDTKIRIFIDFPGTPRAQCGMAYCYSEDIHPVLDKKISYLYFDLIIYKPDIPYLKDMKVDLLSDNLEKKITLFAPHAKYKKKKIFNSSLEEKIDYFLSTVINPTLLSHGGQVSLIEITKEKYVILNFSGSCNGCSMIDITLKERIEKKIINCFPEINGVKDVTVHSRGLHSYY